MSLSFSVSSSLFFEEIKSVAFPVLSQDFCSRICPPPSRLMKFKLHLRLDAAILFCRKCASCTCNVKNATDRCIITSSKGTQGKMDKLTFTARFVSLAFFMLSGKIANKCRKPDSDTSPLVSGSVGSLRLNSLRELSLDCWIQCAECRKDFECRDSFLLVPCLLLFICTPLISPPPPPPPPRHLL